MVTIIRMPQRRRPAVAFPPGQRRRAYTPVMAEEVSSYLDMFEASVTYREGVQMELLDEKMWEFASRVRKEMLRRIINSIDLAGLEYRDGLGKLVMVIRAVADPVDDEISPSEAWVHHKGGVMRMKDFFHSLNHRFHYVCLPGCDNYGDRAMAEAFWARLAEWGIFPETRKRRVPPSAIFDEPEP